MKIRVRPAKLFRVDVMQTDGTEACGFADSFAEAIDIASRCAHVSMPAPRIFELDTATFVPLKELRWLA